MTGAFETFAAWALHAVTAGGLVLFGGYVAVKGTRSAARKRSAGGAAVLAALLAAGASAFPAWLTLPKWSAPAGRPGEYDPAVDRTPQSLRVAAARPRAVVAEVAEPDAPVADQLSPLQEVYAPPPEPPAAKPAPVPTPWEQIAPLLGFVYGGFALVFFGQLACGHFALVRLRRRAAPAPAAVQAQFAALARGIPWGPRVLVSRAVPGPVCFGLVRPTVLLPQALATHGSPEQIRWVLAHECEHLRRGDAWAGVVVALARAVFFPVPWFWAVRRDLGLAQEYLADAAAAAAGGAKTDYAAFLVDLSAGPGRHPGPAVGARAKQSDLYRRISMLVQPNPGADRPAGKTWRLVAAGGLLATGAVLSGVGFADDTPKAAKTLTVVGEPVQGGTMTVRVADADGVTADVAKLKKAVEEAAKTGDEKKLNAAVDALAKALAQPKTMTVTGNAVMIDGKDTMHFHAVPAVPGVAVGKPAAMTTRIVRIGDGDAVRELEKSAAELERAAEKLKDQPEAVESLKKSLAELKKKIAEEKKKTADLPPAVVKRARVAEIAPLQGRVVPVPAVPAVPGVPLAPLPPDAPQVFRFTVNGQEVNKEAIEQLKKGAAQVMEGYRKQLAELKDNPEAEKALKTAMEAYEKAIAKAVAGLAADVPHALAFNAQFNDWQSGGQAKGVWATAGVPNQGRIGIVPAEIPDVLVAQLDVPNGEGVLIESVVKGSAAEKAGLKANDVLLVFAGKPVPAAVEALPKLVADLPAGPADVVVLRKGKKETVKLDVPEKPKAAKALFRAENKDAGPKFSSTSVSVKDGDFTIAAQSDAATYLLKGTVADGTAVPAAIIVTPAGGKGEKYSAVKDVPAEHKAAVEKLLKSVGK